MQSILYIIANIRFCITKYFKYIYKKVQIGGEPNDDSNIAIDETFITYYDESQVWFVGVINF